MLDQINACVLIPTYNNAKTLRRVIDGVFAFSSENGVIVVNDGSTDDTADILKSYGNRILVLEHYPNQGKGTALKKGFAKATELGFDYALTIDSDGQHLPADIPVFINAAKLNPGALVMGSRNMNQEGVPGKSSFGNKFSSFWFWVETGIKLPDTQTGYRLYPLEPIRNIRLFTRKFETEIEVIVKLAWRDVKIVSEKINVIYDPSERVSHFRPFKDFTRISLLNTWFFTLTLLYYLPRRLFLKVWNKGLWTIFREELFKSDESNLTKAASIGFGFFMGIVPIWGFQLLIGIPLSIWFRMNKVLFIAAANISIPPMIPLIIFASYKMGGWLYPNQDPIQFDSWETITLKEIHLNFMQYFTGGCTLALLTGAAGFALSFAAFHFFRKNSAAAG